ncbi:MAG: T9SS type A sorting domain-containing protein, partial [candidate division KSB1 bacterium]|nr:T9SS type A sorting domain-containing protein [candidate division KSB1 bacterium]
ANGKDAGYSLEVVVHTDMFGYEDGDTVKLSVVIWDVDFASADAFNPDVSDYAPHWWGTQWADANFEKYYMYREVILSEQTSVGVASRDVASLPKRFELAQNFPNPFNPSTTIAYELPKTTRVKVEVFDVLGRRVATLFDGVQEAGSHQVTWDGRTEAGEPAPSGVYLYKLSTPDYSQIRKMLLVK